MFVILALFVPRLVSIYLWFFSDWFPGVFETHLWPILGFLFMPYTTLWYSAVVNWYQGDWGFWQIIVMIIAIVADISSDSSASNR